MQPLPILIAWMMVGTGGPNGVVWPDLNTIRPAYAVLFSNFLLREGPAQSTSPELTDRATHDLIAALSSAVAPSALGGLDEPGRAERLRSITVQIVGLIDQYVGESLQATETS